jgi:hypothetical protein
VLFLLAIALPYRFWLLQLGQFPVVSDPLQPCDAIVLTYTPTHAQARHVAELYLAGYGRWVVASNFKVDIVGVPALETALFVKRELADQGVPPDRILTMEELPTSTYEEASIVKRIFQREGIRSAIVVGKPYRMRRAIGAYRRAMGREILLLANPSPDDEFNPRTWWQSRQGIDALYNEYPRLLYYFLKGRLWGSFVTALNTIRGLASGSSPDIVSFPVCALLPSGLPWQTPRPPSLDPLQAAPV